VNRWATLSALLAERIWPPMGAEYDALWNLDREYGGIEKTESGLAAVYFCPSLSVTWSVPLAPGEEGGTRADFSPLVEQRDIDFARASLPNVGGITEMLKIMAVCDTHKVGIVPHFTGPIATAGHMHTMMAFPGQVLMEYNQGERPVPYLLEFLDCKNGKVWPNDRPGLGVAVDEKQLTFIEAMTEAGPGPTHRRPDGSLSHW